jgi:MFS family permease
MDPEAGTQFLGLFIAAQPLAQLFFSPLLGYLGNKFGSIRLLSILSTLILAAGFVLYACVSALPGQRRWYLFAARFLVGAAAGLIDSNYFSLIIIIFYSNLNLFQDRLRSALVTSHRPRRSKKEQRPFRFSVWPVRRPSSSDQVFLIELIHFPTEFVHNY